MKGNVAKAVSGVVALSLSMMGAAGGSEARHLRSAEKEVIAEAVRSELKDPDSAQFKWGEVKGVTYCALVNSKNAFGGYVGFTPFSVVIIAHDEKAIMADPNDAKNEIVTALSVLLGGGDTADAIVYEHCAESGYGIKYFQAIR